MTEEDVDLTLTAWARDYAAGKSLPDGFSERLRLSVRHSRMMFRLKLTAIIALATLVLTVVNLFTIYNYRLQLRVYNAFFAMVTIIIILAMCIDYQDMATYVPILNLCLSVQVAHAFTVAPFTKRYFIVVGLAALCLIEFGISLLVG